jgi:hypothetical protein
MRKTLGVIIVVLLVQLTVISGVAAQCKVGRPCRVPVPKPSTPKKERPKEITLIADVPTADPPSSEVASHQPLPWNPKEKYVTLNIYIRDERRIPWARAEVGISDGSRWVGGAFGFKLNDDRNITYKGRTRFRLVPCSRRLRLVVFFLDSNSSYLVATKPYDFTASCGKPTYNMFFVLNRSSRPS